ncbi:MAG: translocation/assembly module TamB, partial [Fimbriimonadales bacterium]|nr:translocation/assembly module TamB [Fimbriimonadales bacterium]
GDLFTLRATAKSEKEGSLEGSTTLRWTDGEILQGQWDLKHFFIRYEDETLMRAQASLNAEIALEGPWRKPKVTGNLSLQEGFLHLLGEFQPVTPQVPPLEPEWDIQVRLLPSRFRSGLLDAVITGGGRLAGSWSEPRLSMDFQVGRGKISLPSGDVDLEAGGTARLAYSPASLSERASLRVNLPARTFATMATPFLVQRYTINLNISGDLLGDQPLHIDAVSDPPDLSRSEILSLLAQRQFFEEIAGLAMGNLEQRVSHIFTSVLAPYALGPLTRSLERELGLEYVYLDLSQEGIGMIAFGKTLGAGFSAEYRRALTEEMVARFQALDQIQLNYRPQTHDPFFSRLRASVAYDRLGIWRLTLNYGKRF